MSRGFYVSLGAILAILGLVWLLHRTDGHRKDTVDADYLKPRGEMPCSLKRIQKITAEDILGYGPLCRAKNEQEWNRPLILEGLDVSVNRPVDAVQRQAVLRNASIKLFPAEMYITLNRLVPSTKPDGTPAPQYPPWNEHTEIRLTIAKGNVAGINACQTLVSGDYQDRLNIATSNAFGLPSYSNSDGSRLTMEWGLGRRLDVSGSPNFARLQVGDQPPSIKRRAGDWMVNVFDELVALEDRKGAVAARSDIAQRYCMTDTELENIIVPQLRAGRQPAHP